MEISIHALVKRATGYIFDKDGNVYDFNPRPRKEGDLRRISDTLCRIISIHALVKRATKIYDLKAKIWNISIHALVKRATKTATFTQITGKISIHALVKRATNCKVSVYKYRINFNPRPRKEGDGTASEFTLTVTDFNPRPRKEGDLFPCQKLAKILISIHALVKRATVCAEVDTSIPFISIHALVKRATSISPMTFLSCQFQSTPS